MAKPSKPSKSAKPTKKSASPMVKQPAAKPAAVKQTAVKASPKRPMVKQPASKSVAVKPSVKPVSKPVAKAAAKPVAAKAVTAKSAKPPVPVLQPKLAVVGKLAAAPVPPTSSKGVGSSTPVTKSAPASAAPANSALANSAPASSTLANSAPAKAPKSGGKKAPAVPAMIIPRNAVIIPAPLPGQVRIVKPVPKPAESKSAKAEPAVKFPNNAPVPLPPVPTNGKPKKNLAGLNVRELEHYREQLLLKRRELVGDMSAMEREALRSSGTNLSNLPLHMADQGTDNYEQEFTLGLVEKDRVLLREINRALAKIQDGSYGICEGTGKPINQPRLEAQPWAKYSIEYARMIERGLVRR